MGARLAIDRRLGRELELWSFLGIWSIDKLRRRAGYSSASRNHLVGRFAPPSAYLVAEGLILVGEEEACALRGLSPFHSSATTSSSASPALARGSDRLARRLGHQALVADLVPPREARGGLRLACASPRTSGVHARPAARRRAAPARRLERRSSSAARCSPGSLRDRGSASSPRAARYTPEAPPERGSLGVIVRDRALPALPRLRDLRLARLRGLRDRACRSRWSTRTASHRRPGGSSSSSTRSR